MPPHSNPHPEYRRREQIPPPISDTSALRIRSLILWISAQLITLTIASRGVPLWARHPAPRESTAAAELIAVQIALAAMVFPFLLPNRSTTIAVVFLALPFGQLVGMLSSISESQILCGWIYLTIWLVGLSCCSQLIGSDPRAKLWAICAASLFALGGVIAWYLHLEAMEGSGGSGNPGVYGPILGAIGEVTAADDQRFKWGEVGIPAIIGFVGLLTRWISTSSHNPPELRAPNP